MIKLVTTRLQPTKTCDDCGFLTVTNCFRCNSKEAVEENNSNIPTFKACKHWKPMKRYRELSLYERWFGDIFIMD